MRQVGPLEARDLAGQGDEDVHDGADGGVVVQADEGVHLKALAAEHDLYHDDADGLEGDAADLVEEADHGELDLAEGGEGDAGDDDEDVEQGGEAGVGDAPGPRGEEDGDGGGRLEHLDEGDGEVEVDEVGADEGARVEEADGADGAEVEARRDGELVARVEEGGGAGEELRREGGEDEVPAGEEDGCACQLRCSRARTWRCWASGSGDRGVRRTVSCDGAVSFVGHVTSRDSRGPY